LVVSIFHADQTAFVEEIKNLDCKHICILPTNKWSSFSVTRIWHFVWVMAATHRKRKKMKHFFRIFQPVVLFSALFCFVLRKQIWKWRSQKPCRFVPFKKIAIFFPRFPPKIKRKLNQIKVGLISGRMRLVHRT
jgi:hypothetical protein